MGAITFAPDGTMTGAGCWRAYGVPAGIGCGLARANTPFSFWPDPRRPSRSKSPGGQRICGDGHVLLTQFRGIQIAKRRPWLDGGCIRAYRSSALSAEFAFPGALWPPSAARHCANKEDASSYAARS
jgi:hypothetical protein